MRVSSVWAGNEATATKTVLFSDRFRIPSLIPRGISCGGSSDDSRYPYATLVDSLTYHRYLSDKYQTLYQPSLTSYQSNIQLSLTSLLLPQYGLTAISFIRNLPAFNFVPTFLTYPVHISGSHNVRHYFAITTSPNLTPFCHLRLPIFTTHATKLPTVPKILCRFFSPDSPLFSQTDLSLQLYSNSFFLR